MIGKTISVTDAVTEFKLDHRHLLLINDGSESIFVKAEQGSDHPEQVEADSGEFFELKAGETFLMDAQLSFVAVSVVCSSGLSSTLRYAAWK